MSIERTPQDIARANIDLHRIQFSALEPEYIYKNLDEAMHAASCLSGLHPEGATVYGTTDESVAYPETGEAYIVACKSVRVDGSTWAVPEAPYEHVFTITRHLPNGRR